MSQLSKEQIVSKIRKLRKLDELIGLSEEKMSELGILEEALETVAEEEAKEDEKRSKERHQILQKQLCEEAKQLKDTIELGICPKMDPSLYLKITSGIHRSLSYDLAYCLDRVSQLSWQLKESEDSIIAGSPYEDTRSQELSNLEEQIELTQKLMIVYASLFQDCKEELSQLPNWVPTLISWREVLVQRAKSREAKLLESASRKDEGLMKQKQYQNDIAMLVGTIRV